MTIKRDYQNCLLFKLIKNDVKIFSSEAILSEYKAVLKRDFGFTDEKIINIMGKVAFFLNLVMPAENVDVIKEDPADNKIIECALSSSSDYLITYDKHLLNLKSFEKIKIITPEKAFGLLE